MANRRYYGDAGGNIGITFAPDESVKLNPAFDPSQDVSATNPVTMASKQGFLRKLLGGSGSAADAFNAEAALRQALTKQAFNNSMALQKMQEEAAMARQTVGDKAALERALALETARSKAQRESNLETATFNEGIAQREAMRQANLKEDELARQERDLSAKGRAIWDSSARGELPYTLNPDVNPEDYATVARMAPAIFGKDFADSGMINQPVMASKREADIATNVLAEKLASDPQVYAAKVGKLIADQQIPVSKDTASFSASPLFNDFIGNRTVTGKELVNMGGSMIPMDVTKDFPAQRLPSDADRRATVERDYQEAMAKKAASAPAAPVATSEVNPFRAQLETRINEDERTKNQIQLGEYMQQIRQLQNRIKAGGEPVYSSAGVGAPAIQGFQPHSENFIQKLLQQAAAIEDQRRALLLKTAKRPLSKQQ